MKSEDIVKVSKLRVHFWLPVQLWLHIQFGYIYNLVTCRHLVTQYKIIKYGIQI